VIAWLLSLAVLSGLSMNLVLQLGLGARELALGGEPGDPGGGRAPSGLPAGLCAFLVSVPLLWLALSLARQILPLGFFEYVLAFPASLAASSAWGLLPWGRKARGPDAFGGGALAGAALFVALLVAGGLAEAVALALGFAGGALLAFAIVAEIKRRAGMEAVPRWLRGAPLALVAMGLLSLVFSSAAAMLFGALGGG